MPDFDFTLDAILRDGGITHRFISDKADGGNDELVRPSNWNDDHDLTGAQGTEGGWAPLDSGLLIPKQYVGGVRSITAALETSEGSLKWDSATKVLAVYDSQRDRSLSEVGWGIVFYHSGYSASAALTTALSLAANGGTVALQIPVVGQFRLGDVAVRNTDSASARSWRWDLYVQDVNNGNGSESTVRRVAECTSAESFTASAASIRFRGASGGPIYLGPGVYWLLIQNTHATNTFGVGTTASNVLGVGINHARTKTTTNPNGSTIDLQAATWTASSAIIGAMIRGVVLGQSAVF